MFVCLFVFSRGYLYLIWQILQGKDVICTLNCVCCFVCLFVCFVFCVHTIGLLNVWSLATYSVEQLQLQVKNETKAVSTFKSEYAWLEMTVERFSKF